MTEVNINARENTLPDDVNARYDRYGNLKAARVYPKPEGHLEVEVDMTKHHLALVGLSVASVGLGATTAYLWRKVRKQDEHMEAVREYLSRLINETSCGKGAYVTFLVDEDLDDEETVNWANEREPVDEDDLAEKIDQ